MERITNSCGKKRGCHADDGLPIDNSIQPIYGRMGLPPRLLLSASGSILKVGAAINLDVDNFSQNSVWFRQGNALQAA